MVMLSLMKLMMLVMILVIDAGGAGGEENGHLRPPSLWPLRPSRSSLCLYADLNNDDGNEDDNNDDGDSEDDDDEIEACLSRQRSPKERRTWTKIMKSNQFQELQNVAL